MTIKNSLLSAIKSLSKNKMRTALTSIGIIIGVSSVIIMIGIGNSATIAVKTKFNTYGTNAISILSSKKLFNVVDYKNLKNSYPQIKYITPVNSKRNILAKHKNKNLISHFYGVNNDYFKLKNMPLNHGRYFSEYEILAYDKVAIIGNTVSKELFDMNDPIGELILIANIPFRVIGTLEEMGTALSGRDFDNIIISPYTTVAVKVLGRKGFSEIYVSAHSESKVDETANLIKRYFRKVHSIPIGQPDNLKISTSKQKLEMVDYISETLSYLLAGIASISLFVGGVGIMNIMLVSVSERTREIGIRMAIGAKGKDILLQFLIESVMLSSIGGLTGIILGILIYYIIVSLPVLQWPFLFSISSVLISFLFSSSVGIAFGYYPAKKASNLNPIDALRNE